MKSFKKLFALVLSVALISTAITAGTIAYLQDADSDVNVMTLGNVKIEQHEYERVVENGTYKTDTIDEQTSYVLQDFTQAKPLYPIVGDPTKGANDPEYAGYDETTVRMSQVDSYGGMQVFAGKNAQDKFVTVENTGKSDAYVRTIVAVEVGNGSAALIGKSYHSTWMKNDIGTVKINGNNYYVTEFNYNGGQLSNGTWRHQYGILPAGDTTYPNLSQVYLKSEATNDDMVALDGNGNGTLEILVLSQAVQVEGFADAKTALDTAFGETSKKVAEWLTKGEMSNPEIEFTPAEEGIEVEGADKNAVLAAIEKAQPGDVVVLTEDTVIAGYNSDKKLVIDKAITLDLNGKTITTECGWGGIDLKGGASIVNGTINHTGNTAAIKAFQVGKIENVVINVTQTAGKTKGGIVVQEGATYIESIKNVVINGATNGIETYRCGKRTDLAIGSMENVTINATDTGIKLSAPIGTIKNSTIKGAKYGIYAHLVGEYSVTAKLENCTVNGTTDIYAWDEPGITNPGSVNIVLDSVTGLDCTIVKQFEAEVADRVFVGIK